MKTILFILTATLFSACVNKHGISAQYYSDCKEYYDLQGYYHKDCGEDDVITYKGAKEKTQEAIDYILEDENQKNSNVY